MNVCFVCSEYPPGRHGGIGTFTQVLGRALVRGGHQVRVIGTYAEGSSEPPYCEDQGVRVWRLPEHAGRLGWINARRALFKLASTWARRGEIDLVEVPDWMGPAAWWPRLHVPVIVRMNGSASFYARELGQPVSRTNFHLERSSMRRADFHCSSSRYTAEVTERLFDLRNGRSTVLPNPVEISDDMSRVEDAVARSANRVVFTGTLTAKKGVVSLVQAWPRVRAACGDAELHLFGKDSRLHDGGSMQAHLETLLDEAVCGSVHFHGHVTRDVLFAELRGAAAAVFPSHSEAFGIAVIEAMARGCPTIFSRRAAGPEVIRDEGDGLLVEPDDPEAIAGAIIRILRDPRLAARLGAAGRARVLEDFSVEVMLRRNETFYAECIARFEGH